MTQVDSPGIPVGALRTGRAGTLGHRLPDTELEALMMTAPGGVPQETAGDVETRQLNKAAWIAAALDSNELSEFQSTLIRMIDIRGLSYRECEIAFTWMEEHETLPDGTPGVTKSVMEREHKAALRILGSILGPNLHAIMRGVGPGDMEEQ